MTPADIERGAAALFHLKYGDKYPWPESATPAERRQYRAMAEAVIRSFSIEGARALEEVGR